MRWKGSERYKAASFAAKNNLPVAGRHKQFVDYLLKNNPENKEKNMLTCDRVHTNDKGNQLIADVLWKSLKDLK